MDPTLSWKHGKRSENHTCLSIALRQRNWVLTNRQQIHMQAIRVTLGVGKRAERETEMKSELQI